MGNSFNAREQPALLTHFNSITQFSHPGCNQRLQSAGRVPLFGIVPDQVWQLFHVPMHLIRTRLVKSQVTVLASQHKTALPSFSLSNIDTDCLELLDDQQRMRDPLAVFLVPHLAPEREHADAHYYEQHARGNRLVGRGHRRTEGSPCLFPSADG